MHAVGRFVLTVLRCIRAAIRCIQAGGSFVNAVMSCMFIVGHFVNAEVRKCDSSCSAIRKSMKQSK
jgi:hypothetical protein